MEFDHQVLGIAAVYSMCGHIGIEAFTHNYQLASCLIPNDQTVGAVRIEDESEFQFCGSVYKCSFPKKYSFKQNDTENFILSVRPQILISNFLRGRSISRKMGHFFRYQTYFISQSNRIYIYIIQYIIQYVVQLGRCKFQGKNMTY